MLTPPATANKRQSFVLYSGRYCPNSGTAGLAVMGMSHSVIPVTVLCAAHPPAPVVQEADDLALISVATPSDVICDGPSCNAPRW